MTIVMVIECSTCGFQYEPTREAIIAGTWRKACPICFPASPDKEAG